MTRYTPFSLEGSKYNVCAVCDSDKEITKALELQEERKAKYIQGYIRKLISHGLCDPHYAEQRQAGLDYLKNGKEEKLEEFVRPMGVDLPEKPKLLSEEDFNKILDETAAKFDDYKPKSDFNFVEYLHMPIRPGQAIIPHIDPRT